MMMYTTARTAFRTLRRNPMRAMLTTLGIVIGVGAVIAMMEIGAGASGALKKTIASMGANVLVIRPGTASSGGVSFGAGTTTTLTPEDCQAILRECPAVRNAAPMVRARTQVVYGNRNWVPNAIYGTTPAYLDVQDWSILAEGEPFNDRDVLNGNRVCILGQSLVRELFDGESAVGKEIRIKNIAFRVVGVLSPKGANMMGFDQDDVILAPWTTIKYRVTGASASTANQSASVASDSVNTLSNLYPTAQRSLYPERSAVQQANNPMPVRFANIDQIMATARSRLVISLVVVERVRVSSAMSRRLKSSGASARIRCRSRSTPEICSMARGISAELLAASMIWSILAKRTGMGLLACWTAERSG